MLPRFRRVRRRLAVALTLVIACFGMSLLPVNAAPSKKGMVKGCYSKKTGSLRITAGRKRCKRGERRIAWHRKGSRGPRGARGPAGGPGFQPGNGAAGQAGPAGPLGPIGPAGPAGATGPTGSTGPIGPTGPSDSGSTGPTGPTGPSDSFEARNPGPVTLTGTDSGSANSLATLSGLSPGSYLVSARVQLNSSATTSSRVVCDVSLGGKSLNGIADIGTSNGNVAHSVVTMTFNVSLVSSDSANLKCHREALTGSAPTASEAYLEILRVGTATSQTVGS
jgi:hypothetical protein